eukprot:NODE_543_length_6878_cov_0.317008.p1 type:complete len:527 gc:universal NODE_543_length_6878_cov_0.317008:4267-2687(-)
MLSYDYDEDMLFFPSFVFTATFLISLVLLVQKNFKGFLVLFSIATAAAGFIINQERPSLKLNFDPFYILEMSTEGSMINDITEQEIKRAYRKLSLKWHPDRMQFNPDKNLTAEDIHDKFTQINLAKQTLLDPLMRSNWEECGDPNGCSIGFASSMGLALPSWVVTTYSPWVVLLYMLSLGVAVPFFLANWWYSSTILTRDGVHTKVAKHVFKQFSENISWNSLCLLISSSLVYDPECVAILMKIDRNSLQPLVDEIQQQLEIRGHKLLEYSEMDEKSNEYLLYLLFHCQLLRISPFNIISISKQDYDTVVYQFYKVVAKTMLKIALARQWLSNVVACLDLSQLLVQANWANDSSLFQLPHMSHSTLKTLKGRRKSVKTITNVAEAGDIRGLFNMLTDREYADIMDMLNKYPRLVLEGADFRVKGETNITPSALVTCTIKIRSVSVLKSKEELKAEWELYQKSNTANEENEVDDLQLNDADGESFLVNLEDPEDAPTGHAPFFPQVLLVNLAETCALVVVYRKSIQQ